MHKHSHIEWSSSGCSVLQWQGRTQGLNLNPLSYKCNSLTTVLQTHSYQKQMRKGWIHMQMSIKKIFFCLRIQSRRAEFTASSTERKCAEMRLQLPDGKNSNSRERGQRQETKAHTVQREPRSRKNSLTRLVNKMSAHLTSLFMSHCRYPLALARGRKVNCVKGEAA